MKGYFAFKYGARSKSPISKMSCSTKFVQCSSTTVRYCNSCQICNFKNARKKERKEGREKGERLGGGKIKGRRKREQERRKLEREGKRE